MSTLGLDVDFKTLFSIVGPVIEIGYPVLIRGRHGIGKSEVVYQIGQSLYANEKTGEVRFITDKSKVPAGFVALEIVERRASQMTEGDLVGLPSVAGNRTSFNPPDWFKTACEKPCLVFVDEIDRGVMEVRQGFFELTDSRKLNGHTLHPGSRIVGAVNGGKHAAQYQVGEMDPAELDRWTVFDVEPTVEDWLIWANAINSKTGQKNIHPMIIDFIRSEKGHLEHDTKSQYVPNQKYPSRRSWKRASDVLSLGGYLNEDKYDPNIAVLSNGFVGFEACSSFSKFIQTYKRRLTPEDIIKKGKWKEAEKFENTEHVQMAQKMLDCGILGKALSEKEIENLVHYMLEIPSEPCLLLFKNIGTGNVKSNTTVFYKMTVEHKGQKYVVAQHFTKLLAPQKATETK